MASRRFPGRERIPLFFPFFCTHLVDVLFGRLREFVFFFNSLQSSCQHSREGKWEIAGGVGEASFDPGGPLLPWLVHGDPDGTRPVLPCPGKLGGSLETRNQPLIRIHPLVGDGNDSRGVSQNSGDVMLCCAGKVVLVLGIKEGVVLSLEQTLVDVHATTVLSVNRFGHEGNVGVMLFGHLLG